MQKTIYPEGSKIEIFKEAYMSEFNKDQQIENMHKELESLKQENAELRACLKEINRQELNSQRPGGGYSTSARLSYEILTKYKKD